METIRVRVDNVSSAFHDAIGTIVQGDPMSKAKLVRLDKNQDIMAFAHDELVPIHDSEAGSNLYRAVRRLRRTLVIDVAYSDDPASGEQRWDDVANYTVAEMIEEEQRSLLSQWFGTTECDVFTDTWEELPPR